MKTMSVILLLILSMPAMAADRPPSAIWNATDKALLVSYAALSGLDMAQTDRALGAGYKEANPTYGSNPSSGRLVLTKLVVFGVVWYFTDQNSDARRPALIIANIIQGAVVYHNARTIQ